MLRKVGGETAQAVLVPILVACFTIVTITPLAAAGLLVEPGVPLADGRWLLPVGLVDAEGDVSPPVAGDVVVTGPDGEDLAFDVVSFAPRPEGLPTARVLLMDGSGRGAADAEVLGRFLAAAVAGSPRQVVHGRAEPDFAWDDAVAPAGPGEATRLWDSVLAAVGLLAAREDVHRRVLVLVSAGEEDQASEHVLASCVEAAVRARVGVHVLVPAADAAGSAGVARLRVLAARTGGSVRLAGDEPARDLERLLTAVDAVAGLRGRTPAGATWPLRLAVRRPAAPAAPVEAEVAPPRALRGAGAGRWLIPAAGLVAVAAAGWWLWRRQRRTVGVLLVRTRGGQRRFPVPRSGVSLGTDPDNSLVLPSTRLARHHAVIRVRGDELHLTDLRSVGGTQVNGQPVRTRQLADGDCILLSGTVELIYRNGDR